jgi:hypothetical protein
MATIAATTIITAQTREATVEEIKKDTKAFNKKNTMSVTN